MARNSITITALVLISLAAWGSAKEDPNDPDPKKFKIWGPGLSGDFQMPVRYFFIQAVNKAGRNITERLPLNFQIMTEDVTRGKTISTYSEVIYLHDGIYLYRARLHHSVEYSRINVTVMYNYEPLGAGPVSWKNPLYSEGCHCPHSNFTEWMERLNCPETYSQIEEDFRSFKVVDMDQGMKAFLKIFHEGSVAVCRYILRSNKIFRKCYGKHVGFHMFSDQILVSLTRKVVLPDMDFLLNLGDWPLSKKGEEPFPILSWCGSHDTYDIVLPSYEFMESVLEMMGRTSIDLFNIMSQAIVPWSQRSNIGFFRGRDSSQERLDLVRLSLKKPGLIDARLTNMFFFPNDSSLGQRSPHIPLFEFFQHKYQINMDGTVAPYRTGYLLAGGSVMLKQESPYYEHFYSMLRPNVHFIPLRRNIGDIVEKLVWLRTHDNEARKIAMNGRDFAVNELSPQAAFCYYGRVFEKYASKLKAMPTDESPGPEFEHVTHSEYSRQENCRCQSGAAKHDEL